MKRLRSPFLYLCRVLFALSVIWAALILGSAGCGSGAVCYRNTDCPIGSGCDKGQCVRDVASAGSSSSAGAAGGSAVVETPDAGDGADAADAADAEPSP